MHTASVEHTVCATCLASHSLQGASWSTPRRGFAFHDPNPPEVTAHVGAADVPWSLLPGAGGSGASAAGSNAVDGGIFKFAVYLESTQVGVYWGTGLLLQYGAGTCCCTWPGNRACKLRNVWATHVHSAGAPMPALKPLRA